ncbi:MAG: beta-glucuronidase [Bacteroidales bacterium]|nr:beta-glucuronidase [Bacteroidales bacterium]
MRKIIITLTALIAGLSLSAQEIDLSGEWRFQSDVMDFRRGSLSPRYNHVLPGSITLPGITDDFNIGYQNPYTYVDRLTRLWEYMGPAWYQRDIEIPEDWAGKRIFLYMERTHWLSCVWVDTKEVSRQDYVSVPHVHDLSDYLVPGKTHRVTLCIDNRFQYETHKWDHSHTEFTQINWNGVLGEFRLFALDPVYVDDFQVYPDVDKSKVDVKLTISNFTDSSSQASYSLKISSPDGKSFACDKQAEVRTGQSEHSFSVAIADPVLWDEFHPELYRAELTLRTKEGYNHSVCLNFGMRSIGKDRHHIMLNGHPIHLRGTVENAVFPSTGHAPVDEPSWERIMNICKQYGLNHMRFHSWCPPDAAFRAADKAGIYFEIEMPMWGKDALEDTGRYDFFRREIKAILKTYGNHPSFLLYCNGNEIQGNFDFVEELTSMGISMDSRHLYSGSTARTRVPSDQYYISQETPKGPAKVYEGRPGTDWDTNEACDVDVPIISHESGQRCVYPHFTEIEKYKGPVRARNLELWRKMLSDNGMAHQAEDFFKASGALTVLEYKAVIEAHLRSSLSAGFQLLSLNDFTGQGYAPVGILDAFWDSKGLVTPEQWRGFCSASTVLLRYPKCTFFSDETFSSSVELYNYTGKSSRAAKVSWKLSDESGKLMAGGVAGTMKVESYDVFKGPAISIKLPSLKIRNARRLTLSVSVEGYGENSWDIWVYPRHDEVKSDDSVLYTDVFDLAAKKALMAGGKVVLTPAPDRVEGRKSVFPNHFWNPIMFAWKPMTMGCLMDVESHVFDEFPSSYHSDWQWWDILTNSKVIDLQDAPAELTPFIQVIDAFDSNRKLGICFEARVCGGKLLVLPLDKEVLKTSPAATGLLFSIDSYVRGEFFNPGVELEEKFIDSFLN